MIKKIEDNLNFPHDSLNESSAGIFLFKIENLNDNIMIGCGLFCLSVRKGASYKEVPSCFHPAPLRQCGLGALAIINPIQPDS